MPTALGLIVGDAVSPALRLAANHTSASLVVGLGLTFGIWIATGVYFSRRMRHLEARASEVATRAREEERQVLARELHDDIGQMLTAIKVELALAQRELEQRGAPAVLDEVKPIADRALQTVREWSQALHSSMLEDGGLVGAVGGVLGRVPVRGTLDVTFAHSGLAQRLDADIEMAAYRIVQESVSNVLKHAAASSLRVTITRGERLCVIVEDDGVGFTSSPVSDGARGDGLGLISMRERAWQLGGTLTIATVPGAGTRVAATLPVALARHQSQPTAGAFARGLIGAAR